MSQIVRICLGCLKCAIDFITFASPTLIADVTRFALAVVARGNVDTLDVTALTLMRTFSTLVDI